MSTREHRPCSTEETSGGFDKQRELQALTRLSSLLARHVVPLFSDVHARPQAVGTGFFVSSGERCFLVSAAHVLDELRRGRELYYYVEPRKRRRLTGQLRTTRELRDGRQARARLDVGALLLEGAGLPPYVQVDKWCLPATALMPRALPRQGKEYLITGFPSSKSRPNPAGRNVTSKVYVFRNVAAAPQKYARLGLSETTHLLVSFDRRRSVFPNQRIATFPDPRGMSGAPVWLLFDEAGPNDPNQTPVVGIAIEHHREEHVIVATDIEAATALISAPW